MIRFFLFLVVLFNFSVYAQNDFTIVVNTNPNVLTFPEYSSTSLTQFILPLRENTLPYSFTYQKVDQNTFEALTPFSTPINIPVNTDKYLISLPESGYFRIKIVSPDNNSIRWANEIGDFINDNPTLSSPDRSYQQKKIFLIEKWGNLAWSDFTMSFMSCSNLNITATDAPILENVISCFGMFMTCSNLTYNVSINNWNVENVEDMTGMFVDCFLFNQPLNNWRVENVLSMENMFSSAYSFNQPLNNWNVSNVFNFNEMFLWADSFNQSLDQWNVSKGYDLSSMFKGASSFNQSLGNWYFNENVNLFQFLSDSGMDCSNYYETLNGWINNPITPSNKSVGVDGLQYTLNTIQPRNMLINDKNWTFNGDVYSETNCLLNNSDFEFHKIVFFPNPATDFLYVTSTNDFVSYEIFDVSGKKVAANDFSEQILIQFLSQGNYVLKLFDKRNRSYTTKFIKK